MDLQQSLRDLTGKGKSVSDVSHLLDRITGGFTRAGYTLLIRNEAWLRAGGIKAAEYINTKDGTRYRNALLIRLSRGNSRAEVSLTDTEPARFKVVWHMDRKPELLEAIDRSIILKLKEKVDQAANDGIEHTLRLLL